MGRAAGHEMATHQHKSVNRREKNNMGTTFQSAQWSALEVAVGQV